MASWLNRCSSARHARRTSPLSLEPSPRAAAAACCALLVAGCGHADTPSGTPAPASQAEIFCAPAPEGFLRARLQGSIDAEIDWSHLWSRNASVAHDRAAMACDWSSKGAVDDSPLLIVIGVANLLPGTSARNVAANVTLVREARAAFYSTQGDDKCALDDVRQEPVDGREGRYRVSARGYCTQPARALGASDAGSVLVTRFDVSALVDYPQD
jgi:hypothetical protein